MGIAAAAIAAAGAVGGAMITANGQKAAAGDANAQREAAYQRARDYVEGLGSMGKKWLANAFGDKLRPEAFLYHKVDLTKSQLDTIQGNLKAYPTATELTEKVNQSIWSNDLGRIRSLMPQFDNARDSYVGTTRMLQEGRLPFSDVMDITAKSSSLAASTGTPGGSRNATLRDLGLSRLDAMDKGNSMFAQFMQIAQQISPVEHQMRPQQMMFTPQERGQFDITQAQLDQQGRASAEIARAMPDPAQNALVNANMGIEMAAMGAPYNPTAGGGSAAMGQGIAAAAGIVGQYMQRQQQPMYQQTPPGGYGGGYGGGGYGGGYGGSLYGYPSEQVMYVQPAQTSQFSPNMGLSTPSQGVDYDVNYISPSSTDFSGTLYA